MLTVIGISRPPGGIVLGRRLVAAHATRAAAGRGWARRGARGGLCAAARGGHGCATRRCAAAGARFVRSREGGRATWSPGRGRAGGGAVAGFPAAPRRTIVAPP